MTKTSSGKVWNYGGKTPLSNKTFAPSTNSKKTPLIRNTRNASRKIQFSCNRNGKSNNDSIVITTKKNKNNSSHLQQGNKFFKNWL